MKNNTNEITQIPLDALFPFRDHPFHIQEDSSMETLMDSIEKHGVSEPVLARPRAEGGYELVSGHRRHRACQLLGLKTMPAQVREMDDDTAAIFMVDSNLTQRQNISYSEKAFALKLWMDANRRQGQRTDLTPDQVGTKLRSDQEIGKRTGDSGRTIQRFIRLTFLIPQLLSMVDEKKIAFTTAVELSYLTPQEQLDLLDDLKETQATPSLSQAQRLKKFSQQECCSHAVICAIIGEEKKPEIVKSVFDDEVFLQELSSYFPANTPPKIQKNILLRLLKNSQIKTQTRPQNER